jgi:oligopeptide transport system ATP-binding protein
VMYLGKIVELASSAELYENPKHPYTQALLASIPLPDPEQTRDRKRIALSGEVPTPMNPPSGCRFHTRCPHVMEKCKTTEPEFKEITPGHFAACFLNE